MKNLKNCRIFLILIFSLFSCSEETDFNDEIISTNEMPKDITDTNRSITRRDMPVYLRDRLIVRYAPGTTSSEKADLRDIYGVTNYKICEHCSDDTIELWMFGLGIDIEPKKTAIEQGSDGGIESAIIDVDYEFTFGIDISNPDLGSLTDYSYSSYIKTSNDGITIAVLDTGLAPTIGDDTSYVFTGPFLYNASGDGNANVYSGWDFVNQDHNSFDDNNGRHGTVVSSIITTILNESSPAVPHQIMPLKVCDENGRASYFNFLCATSFGLEHADILQMSLGWYEDGFGDFLNTIIAAIIDENPNALVVASAGNLENNNDILAHYPSGYSHENIIAVAAADKLVNFDASFSSSNIASFSNYGLESVDFFSKGENIPFLGYEMSGTSFAAPVVTGVLARYKYNHPSYSASELKYQLNISGIPCPTSFNTAKKVLYNKIILP
ncbi:S8 family serine peptidase [Flavobacterium sp. J27]|uniref:S8 family peptidase n=1 Tax=Flavobacterium sp. J27 TaxID=2060419 RepID=UPI0013EE7800|nr:S8 family serine peptidase [Flavobacterium sp. J27]